MGVYPSPPPPLQMARPRGAKNLKITANLNAWLEERYAAFKAGGPLPEMDEGRLRYRIRTITRAQQRERGWSDEEALGNLGNPRQWKAVLSGHLNYWLTAHGVTKGDLNIVNEDQGHLSDESGRLVAYERGQDFKENIVLIVEKAHNAKPIARLLAARGVRVLAVRGQTTHAHRADFQRWRSAGKRVYCLTDEDMGGADVARKMEEFGVERIGLADIEEAAGGHVLDVMVEPDESYTNQQAPHKRLSDKETAFLNALGKRAGFKGPGRVELDGQIEAWGEERYSELVWLALSRKRPAWGPAPVVAQRVSMPHTNITPETWWE